MTVANELTTKEIKDKLSKVARNRCEPPVDEQMVER